MGDIMDTQWLMLRQLDRQLKEWQVLGEKQNRPKIGWVKTIRTALGMTAEQLGRRLGGLSRARIVQLEKAETQDAVTLHSLRNAAAALDCELIYAIVPKKYSTLEEIVKKRAQEVAIERITRVAHSMSLEAQSVDPIEMKQQQNALAKSISEHLGRNLWKNTACQWG